MADNEIKQLLIEIRDNQREALQRQEEHLRIAKEMLDRSKKQIEESIDLQKEAVAKTRTIARFALPAILLCIGLVLYLILKYF